MADNAEQFDAYSPFGIVTPSMATILEIGKHDFDAIIFESASLGEVQHQLVLSNISTPSERRDFEGINMMSCSEVIRDDGFVVKHCVDGAIVSKISDSEDGDMTIKEGGGRNLIKSLFHLYGQ